MDIWNNTGKRLYQMNGNIDEYGVDHSNFSLIDELEYNLKRSQEQNRSYPAVRDDKNNFFNSKVETIVKSIPTSFANNGAMAQTLGAMRDLGENYINMVNANLASSDAMQQAGTTIDNYYHCIGNYDAAKRGIYGQATAATIGLGRELVDYTKNRFRYGTTVARNDFNNDIAVNQYGRDMAINNFYNSAYEACEKFRPENYNPNEKWGYYK